jgi:hypothetical protein
MTKPGLKKPRGKPFVKGEDPRRVHGKSGARINAFTREMKQCLLDAAEETGNRMVALSNARLPKQPNQHFTKELIGLLRQDPKGMTSYFMWLAENHPAIFVSLLGRALPQIMQHEQGEDPIEALIRSAEDIDAVFRARHIPPLLTEGVYKLPKRIDLKNPPVIDVTPVKRNGNGEQ